MVAPSMAGDRIVNSASSVLFRRLPYMLSPQLDIYEKLSPLVEGKRVLEIGFGTGLGTLQYVGSASMIDAIEIDPAAVRFVLRCFGHEKISWFDGDITRWQGEGYRYDFIVMIEVLEHIYLFGDAIEHIQELMNPNAYVLITVPNSRRHRKKQETLNVDDWDHSGFEEDLLEFFDTVRFLDNDLREYSKTPYTTETPIIALCS